MFQRFTAYVGMALMGLAAMPAQAQLASQSTQFSGSVPAVCQVADTVNTSSPMSYVDGVLSGESQAFSFESNGSVALQLRQVQINARPGNATNYSWAAGLRVNNGVQLASATQDGASAVIPYADGLTPNDDFQMTLAIRAPEGVLMAQGNYVATVTTDCIAN